MLSLSAVMGMQHGLDAIRVHGAEFLNHFENVIEFALHLQYLGFRQIDMRQIGHMQDIILRKGHDEIFSFYTETLGPL